MVRITEETLLPPTGPRTSHSIPPIHPNRSKLLIGGIAFLTLVALTLVGVLMASDQDSSQAGPPPALTSVWTGGFEREGFAEYFDAPWNFQGNGPPKLVEQPVASGKFAAAFSLGGGDQRQELVASEGGRAIEFEEGDDLYFSFSTRFASDWPVARTWQVISQWKAEGPGSPPIAMFAGSWGEDRISIGAAGWPGGGSAETHDLGPLVRDRWISWVVRIKFSSDVDESRVEVWRDDERVLETRGWRPSFQGEKAGTDGGTLREGQDSYLKLGLYRDQAITETARLWMDGWKIGERD